MGEGAWSRKPRPASAAYNDLLKGAPPSLMSRRPAHPTPRQAPRRRWWGTVVVVVLLVTVAALLVKRTPWPRGREHAAAVTVSCTVLDTRVVVDHTGDSLRGGFVYYRLEARVRYEAQGQTQDRWLVASKATTVRELLDAMVSKQPRKGLVFWAPGHPEGAKCLLE